MNIREIIEQHILPELHQHEPLWENWYIRECIGTGSFSAVYRIEAKRQSRTDISALKIQPIMPESRLAANDELLQKALEQRRKAAEHESAVMYRLRDCRYIVRYEDEDIRPFHMDGKEAGFVFLIRMEYLQPLPELIRSGRFACTETAVRRLAAEIGEGLRTAHAAGIMHRDVKPENLFAAADGTCKLGDFNISKQSDRTRTYAGTPGFIAPEVLAARQSADADYTAQADIYSFGICLYQMLHDGLFPFEERCTPEEAFRMRMAGEPLPYPKHAGKAFGDVILKACAFRREARYQTMDDLLHDLAALPAVSGDTAQPAVSGAKTEYAEHTGTAYADSTQPAQTVYADKPQTVQNDPAATVYAEAKHERKPFPLKHILIPAAACLVLAAGTAGVLALRANHRQDGTADAGSTDTQTETTVTAQAVTGTAITPAETAADQTTALTAESGTAISQDTAMTGQTSAENAAQRRDTAQHDDNMQQNDPSVQNDPAQNNPVQQENPTQGGQEQPAGDQNCRQQTAPPPQVTTPPMQEPEQPAVTNPLRYSVSGGTVTVEGMNTPSDRPEIPQQIDGYPVTRIADGAFRGSGIRGISLPYGLTQIGAEAFADCGSLTELVLPDSVNTVGSYAFSGSGLTSLRLSSGMTEIGEAAFYGCAQLPKIIIPDSVSVIGKNAFAECPALRTVCIPASVTRIGVNAFAAYPAPPITVYYAGTMDQADRISISDSAFPDALWEYNRYNFDAY